MWNLFTANYDCWLGINHTVDNDCWFRSVRHIIAADLDVEGLAVIVEGVGLLGANPFLAVDLAPTTDPANPMSLSNLEILTGGTIDLGGLSAAVDVSLLSDDVLEIGSWDLGLDYTMGDMAVAFAYDSSNAWGMSASMDVAGFGVDATIYNKAADAHEKNGLFYSLAASTSLNGVGLSLGVDQDLQPTVNLSKSMGGLSLYAGYDASDEGGSIGAPLSFYRNSYRTVYRPARPDPHSQYCTVLSY